MSSPPSYTTSQDTISERTVKYRFSGERGPSGGHLIALARRSDAVLYVVLAPVGRHIVEDADD
jgi:hypothetical protein|tara:strand:- start:31 stop:219 length:189 start_codon:yes stop_codon:yes gene_type:complete